MSDPERDGALANTLAVDPAMASHPGPSRGDEGKSRLPPPALRARYTELRLIGEGGMGTVFRGWDPRLGRAVALKLLKSDDPDDTRRLLREAQAQARVQHDNVCRVYEVGEADGAPYIAMELIDGVPLDRAQTKMSLEQKVKVVREVAAALHEAHRLGLIHRDIKPGNIIVNTDDDGALKPYVVDFGIAREIASSGLTMHHNMIQGTPEYMSPEQAAGASLALDRRADVYSLGATLYELVAGRPPFVGANALAILTQVMREEAPTISSIRRGVPRELETIVMTCLRRDPSRRYESARALGDDLQRFLDGEPIQARRASLAYVLWVKARKHKAAVIIAMVGLCVALALAGMWVQAARHASEQARLGRELGEDVKYAELFLRSAYGLPVHDIERERRVVRVRLAGIERRMVEAGRAGQGPGHYALGRGLLALHDYEAARKHLELALAAEYTRPEVHYALGLALGGRYEEALDGARRIEDRAMREAAMLRAETSYREPAVRHLRASGGTEVESTAYIEGLVALYEKRYDDAAAKGIVAAGESPWLYEAKKLEGDARFGAGIAASESGKEEDARRLFSLAIDAYGAAAAMGRSDSAVHEALAEVWIAVLWLDLWHGRPYRVAFETALSACDDATAADPRSARALIKKARAYSQVGAYQGRNGEDPRPMLGRALETALAAKRIAPEDAISAYSMGNALTSIAKYERKVGLDPVPSIEQALKSFDEATRIQPTFAWAWSDAGVVLQVRAEYEIDKGLDPRAAIDDAVARYERALKENASYIGSYGNMAFIFLIRANYEMSVGRDPRPHARRAIESCARGAALNPHFLAILNNRGWAELVIGQYEEAIGADPSAALDRTEASFQASLDLSKDEADTHFGIGTAKHARALYAIRTGADPTRALDEARAELERAALLDPQESTIRLELGRLAMTMAQRPAPLPGHTASRLDEARKVLEEGVRTNPRHAPLHAALAELFVLRAEHARSHEGAQDLEIEQGLAAAERSLAINPRWAPALAARGTLYALRARRGKDAARADDERRAAESLEAALTTNPLLSQRYKDRLAEVRSASAASAHR